MAVFKDFSKVREDPLYHELAGYSDRASAVVSVAILEGRLTTMLKSKLRPDKDIAHKLTKPSGPIGAFGTKTDLAYLMGFYSKDTRDDFDRLAQVRNKFAHSPAHITFKDKEVMALCRDITFLGRLPESMAVTWDGPRKPMTQLYARFKLIVTSITAAEIMDQISASAEYHQFPSGL